MTKFLLAAGVTALAFLPTACNSTTTSSSRAGVQTVTITPDLKAEIRRRGQDPDEEVRKRVAQAGKIRPENVCMTRAAWEAKTQASQDGTRDIQNNALRTRAPGA